MQIFGGRDSNPIYLGDFDKEVSGVAWHSRDFTNLASCCDDSSLHVWRHSHTLSQLRSPVRALWPLGPCVPLPGSA